MHPGGPFWRGRDQAAWQIPKALVGEGESVVAAARREFHEELGIPLAADPLPLARIRQAGGKWVEAFALEQDLDADAVQSNYFDLEWPPRSGVVQQFPVIDAARWFTLPEAQVATLESQRPLLAALADWLTAAEAETGKAADANDMLK